MLDAIENPSYNLADVSEVTVRAFEESRLGNTTLEHFMASKTTCPVTREEFKADAKAVQVTINGIPMLAEVKEFSTGSLGWYLNGKTTIEVAGKPVSVQIGMNLTIVGSKELPR